MKSIPEDDGKIFIKGTDPADMQRAMDMINAIVSDPEPGKIYKGTITRLMTFGAFVEIAPWQRRSGSHLQDGKQESCKSRRRCSTWR